LRQLLRDVEYAGEGVLIQPRRRDRLSIGQESYPQKWTGTLM
jgi:hypothetical protein